MDLKLAKCGFEMDGFESLADTQPILAHKLINIDAIESPSVEKVVRI